MNKELKDLSFAQHLWRVVRLSLRVHRYSRYATDLTATYLMPFWFRASGLSVKGNTKFVGKPIISLAPRSRIEIGPKCSFISRAANTALGVNHPVILRTLRPGAELRIGSGVRMSGTSICAAERVVIKDRCVIGANVTIVDTDFHSLDPAERNSPQDGISAIAQPVEIGEDVFIGGGSYILKGIRIGDEAVIGAGSVVTRDVPARTMVAGNPAKSIGVVGRKERGAEEGERDTKSCLNL